LTPRQTGRPTVGCNITLTLTLTLTVERVSAVQLRVQLWSVKQRATEAE
jgi:hypothetical protein